jgi:uroporphyrinogen decarboxylase
MTSRERLLKVIQGEITDCVPVSPDISNMVPVKMTGKPFWDIYLYQDPPQWLAYINAAKHFNFDALMDGYVYVPFEELGEIDHEWEEVIIFKDEEKICTQQKKETENGVEWSAKIMVYPRDNPPSHCKPSSIGMAEKPTSWEPVIGKKEWPKGAELIKFAKEQMGHQGLVGIFCGMSSFIHTEDDVYAFADDPDSFYKYRDEYLEHIKIRLEHLLALPEESRPDFICTGYSGTLVLQTVDTFRELGLPVVQYVTKRCKEAGMPTHIHSCGPEKELIKICYNETDLTVIDPLEIPHMGDCVLKEMKELYGDKLILKGNLHTTEVMLFGSVEDVKSAAKQAIDDAAKGGKFILSTGDQCGRDTPHENIFAMIEVARTYGIYAEK